MFRRKSTAKIANVRPFKYSENEPLDISDDYCQVACIDPAVENYALRIERRGVPQDDSPYATYIIPLAFIKTKFNKTEDDICTLYFELNKFLDSYLDLLKECHILMIERQLDKNPAATKVAQQTLAYFMNVAISSAKSPTVIDVDSKNKSRYLGAPKGLVKTQLKNWGVAKALELLRYRQDDWSETVITSNRKKDDLADVVLHIEALFIICKLPITQVY